MTNWANRKIGSFLRERAGRYDPSDKLLNGLKRLKKIDFSGEIHLADKDSKTDMILAHPGDLVISGINVAKGAIAIHSGDKPVAATIHYSSYTFNKDEIDIEFFKRFIQSPVFEEVIKTQVRGGIKTEIKAKSFLPLEIKIPDLPTQKQIVSFFLQIENDLKELNNQIALQQKLIRRLRQQILQDAIEGKLTADWRKQNSSIINDSNDARAFINSLKAPQHKQSSTPTSLTTLVKGEFLNELPKGWALTTLSQIADVGTGATPLTTNSAYYTNGTVNWVTSAATNTPYVEAPDKLISELAIKETNCSVYPAGTLIVALYGQGKTRGQISELRIPAATNQALAAIRPYSQNEYFKRYIKLYFQRMYLEIRELASGGPQPNLNLGKIKSTPIPLPPLSEQKIIVERVAGVLKLIHSLEAQIAERSKLSDILMQSVLREAFQE